MGAAINALGDVGKLLRHNPIIILVSVVALVVFNIVNLMLSLIPFIGQLLALLVYPAFAAGLLGIIYAGRDGTASVDDFVKSIADSYLPLLGGYALLAVSFFALALAVALVSIFALSVSFQTLRSAGIVVMALYAGVMVLVGVTWILIQFFNIAIVAGDGLAQSFRTSISMVLGAPISTLGFMLVKFLITAVLAGLPYLIMAVSLFGFSTAMDPMGINLAALGIAFFVAVAGYVFIALPAVFILTRAYHVMYFNRRQAQRA